MRGREACVRKKPGRKHDVYLPGQDFICDMLRAFRVDVYLGGVYVGIARGSNWQVSPIRGICISPNSSPSCMNTTWAAPNTDAGKSKPCVCHVPACMASGETMGQCPCARQGTLLTAPFLFLAPYCPARF